jgi:hypothetical protein
MSDNLDDEDDPFDSPPSPDAPTVARRALILAAVVCRANMELYDDEVDRQLTVASLPDRLAKLDLWADAEPNEEKILLAPLGSLERWQRVQGTWYVEGLAILCWALRRLDFPPHDLKVSNADVADAISPFSDEAEELLAAPVLRSAEEIKACREWFYSLHCTLRQFLYYGNDGHLPKWIGDYVDTLGLPREAVLVNGSLAFDGAPLAEADREDLEEWEAVIRERHRAVIWLKGSEEPYTEISVDT